MKNQNNEFEKLLSYLEKEQKSVAKRAPKPTKAQLKQKKITSNTKKILEDSIEEYSDLHMLSQHKSASTAGFSVEKFESLMKSKLIDQYKKLQSYERPYISVTELCGCLRKAYYYRQRYEIDVKDEFSFAYLYLIQEVGNTIHEVVQNLYDFGEMEKTVVSEKHKIKGRIDAIKDEFVFELKSIDEHKFKGKFFREHYYQGLIYAYILNTEYNYNIKHITIIYIQRNLKKIFPFDIPVDNKIAEELVSRAKILKGCLTSKSVPEPIGATKEQCRFCSFRKFCEKDVCQMIQPFKSKPKKKVKTKKVSTKKVEPKTDDKKTAFLI